MSFLRQAKKKICNARGRYKKIRPAQWPIKPLVLSFHIIIYYKCPLIKDWLPLLFISVCFVCVKIQETEKELELARGMKEESEVSISNHCIVRCSYIKRECEKVTLLDLFLRREV